MTPAEIADEMHRLSRNIDKGIGELRDQSIALAGAEHDYRKLKAAKWAECPTDDPSVKAGEREWTAARREAWVNAETAGARYERDHAEAMRQTALEAVRARRTQLSAMQTIANAHAAEAEFVRTGPRGAA